MSGLRYVTGDATRPEGTGPRLICHVVNDEGRWGSGFVLALNRRWSAPKEHYLIWCAVPTRLSWAQGHGLPRLGNVQFVEAEPGITVANMMAQRGVRHRADAPRALHYGALVSTLRKTGDWALTQPVVPSLHMPRIGAGLGGGDWGVIENMITEILVDFRELDVTVYDLPGSEWESRR